MNTITIQMSQLADAIYAFYKFDDENNLDKIEKSLVQYDLDKRYGQFNSACLDVLVAKEQSKAFIDWCNQLRHQMIANDLMIFPDFFNNKEEVLLLHDKIKNLIDVKYLLYIDTL